MANDKFQATPQLVGNITVPGDETTQKIETVDFLPRYLQTDKNKKFLNVTLDPLVSKGSAEDINAYVGRKSGTVYRPATDPYIVETRAQRENYQFDIGVVTKDTDGNITHSLAYADIMAQYYKQYSGFLPSDLDSTYYSWTPPIDFDKFVNFSNYYWFPQGLPLIEISGNIDIALGIIGRAEYVIQNPGKPPLAMINGMRVFFANNTISNPGYISADLTKITYFTVEGVGNSIKLLDETYTDPRVSYVKYLQQPWDSVNWDTTPWDETKPGNPDPEYIVMGRGASNKNAWSRINQWQHQDAVQAILGYLELELSSYLTKDARARRSIIEFNSNLELYRHGREAKQSVNAVASSMTLEAFEQLTSLSTIDRYSLVNGARILFINSPELINLNNKIATASIVGNTVTFVNAYDSDSIKDNTLFVLFGNNYKYSELYFEESTTVSSLVAQDGTVTTSTATSSNWVRAQQKTQRNQFPLFSLYDNNGISLSDKTVYKNNNFSGSTLFQYKKGTFIDSILRFGVEYEDTNYDVLNNASPYSKNFTNMKFSWTQNDPNLYYESLEGRTQIPGYYYFKLFNGQRNYTMSSGWVHNSNEALTLQRISKVITDTVPENNLISVPLDIWPSYNFEVFLNTDSLVFNIITKSGQSELWDPSESYLLLPIGQTGVIKNKTEKSIVIKDIKGNIVDNYFITNNTTNKNLTTNIDKSLAAQTNNLLYFVCDNVSIPIYLIDPALDSRSLSVRINGKKISKQSYYLDLSDDEKNYVLQMKVLAINDYVEVLFSSSSSVGVYATHATFEANADNDSIYETSYSKVFEHFVSAISSQTQLKGTPYGSNSYFNTSKNMGMGYSIQQQTNSSLLGGVLSAGKLDAEIVLQKAGDAYSSFRSKFITKIIQLADQVDVNLVTTGDLIDMALSQINVGKNSSFPYAFSNTVQWNGFVSTSYTATSVPTVKYEHNTVYNANEVFNNHIYVYVNDVFTPVTYDSKYVTFTTAPAENAKIVIKVCSKTQPSFVPPSLSKLGINTPWVPCIVTNASGKNYIKCHDGTEITCFDSLTEQYVNLAILEFENRTFSAISLAPVTEKYMHVNEPGACRQTSKSIVDKNIFLEKFYRKWAAKFGITTHENISFDNSNSFTWNYTGLVESIFIDPVTVLPRMSSLLYKAGSWRAIYYNLYDTINPHSAPWEMLGYSIKPVWWDNHYSWTNQQQREKLIKALQSGQVSEPAAPVTIKPHLARSVTVFPINSLGQLLPPDIAGIATVDSMLDAARNWEFGEWGEQEAVWRKSTYFQWAEAVWKYVTCPNKFISRNFDPFDTVIVPVKYLYSNGVVTASGAFSDIVSKTTEKRTSLNSIKLHRDNNAQCSGLNQLFAEYIVTQNKDLQSDYFDLVHYGKIQMIHKIGGYADKRTLAYKADTLKVSAGSNFIPEENFSLQLYTGAPYKELFYSGVKVTWTGTGYEVNGYDTTKNYFTIYNPKLGARSKAITFSNISIIDVLDFDTVPIKVHYGTQFATRQEVYNFFCGLNKVMLAEGFLFEQYDTDLEGILDFKMSGKQFMFWSDSTWTPGNFIGLSPLSDSVKLEYGYGWVADYDSINDYDPILDIDLKKISISDLNFDRTQTGQISVSATLTSPGIFGLAINLSEIEHAAVFDNTTTFGDIVYSPVYRLKQYRLKYSGQRTKDWNGTPYSPGFLLNGNKIIGNFDRTITDISSRYYNVEGATQNSRFMQTARHSIGIEPGGALRDIIGNSNTQFEFQRAALRQKGTPAAYSKLLRSSAVEVTASDVLLADEEWMFKISEFGNLNSIQAWEFKLRHEDFKENKQLIRFNVNYTHGAAGTDWIKNVDSASDRIIDLPFDDTRWIYKPVVNETSNSTFSFGMRRHNINSTEINYNTDVVNAGYAFVEQADLTAETIDNIADLYPSMSVLSDISQWAAGESYSVGQKVRYYGYVYELLASANSVQKFLPIEWKEVEEPKSYKIWVADYVSNVDSLNDERKENQHVPLGWNMLAQQDLSLAVDVIFLPKTSNSVNAAIKFTSRHQLTAGTVIILLNADYLSGIYVVASVVDSYTITVDATVTTEILTGKVMSFMPTRFAVESDLAKGIAIAERLEISVDPSYWAWTVSTI